MGRAIAVRANYTAGPDGLVNIPSPGVPPKLADTHRAFLARIVEGGVPAPTRLGSIGRRVADTWLGHM
jgi:hypothetical protein